MKFTTQEYQTKYGPLWIKSNEQHIYEVHFGTLPFKDEVIQAPLNHQLVIDAIYGQDISDLSLHLDGTDFQKAVWSLIRKIPRGETRFYSQIAAALGDPKGSRAVAAACAANRIAMLIPCHRVVHKSKEIRGYRWGDDLKRVLLTDEGAL